MDIRIVLMGDVFDKNFVSGTIAENVRSFYDEITGLGQKKVNFKKEDEGTVGLADWVVMK